MHIDELRKSDKILLKSISGSHLYGLNTPTSDLDIRGIFINSVTDMAQYFRPSDEIQDIKGDEKYYSLYKFLDLVKDCNPAVLELLFLPESAILYKRPEYDILVENRFSFITKKAYYTYTGYAVSQLKRATGLNKKANKLENYIDKDSFDILIKAIETGIFSQDFVTQIFGDDLVKYLRDKQNISFVKSNKNWGEMKLWYNSNIPNIIKSPMRYDYVYFIDNKSQMPYRPVNIDEQFLKSIDLSRVEHMPNLYRVYKNGKGVHNLDIINCESITIERENTDIIGLLFYNENQYKKDKSEYMSFWEWMANRNEARYTNDWNAEKQCDNKNKFAIQGNCKNMCHLTRLLMEAENIVLNGQPQVRWTGDKLQYLRDIRSGKISYANITAWAESKEKELKELYDKSSLPHSCNMKHVELIWKKIMNLG